MGYPFDDWDYSDWEEEPTLEEITEYHMLREAYEAHDDEPTDLKSQEGRG